MSLFEPGPTHLDPQQLLDLEERKQLLNHCLEVIQQPELRELILSEIARALASNQSEIHVSLPVELIQDHSTRDTLISEIDRTLASAVRENPVSPPVDGEPSELKKVMFSYFDDSFPIHLIIENGQSYTLRLMFMKVGATTIDCDLLIVNY